MSSYPRVPVPFRAACVPGSGIIENPKSKIPNPKSGGPRVSACQLPARPALRCLVLDTPELASFCIKIPESVDINSLLASD